MPLHDAVVARTDRAIANEMDVAWRWRRPAPSGPRPSLFDYTVFFVLLPLLVALWATSVGIGPARVLGFQSGFAYIGIQMLAAWCVNGCTAWIVERLLRRQHLPAAIVLIMGYGLSWAPLYVFYLHHFELFGQLFPQILAYTNRPPVAWSGSYLLHAVRYSFPFLPMWFAALYGYRYLTGVEFFALSRPTHDPPAPPSGHPAPPPADVRPVALQPAAPKVPARAAAAPPAFMSDSRLSPGDAILALKAEEHYIRVWSAGGTDLIRYRFGDAVQEIADHDDGAQVHRSWWINWHAVRGWRQRGRSLQLELINGLHVPVSLAYKAEVHRRVERLAPVNAQKT